MPATNGPPQGNHGCTMSRAFSLPPAAADRAALQHVHAPSRWPPQVSRRACVATPLCSSAIVAGQACCVTGTQVPVGLQCAAWLSTCRSAAIEQLATSEVSKSRRLLAF